MGESHRKCCRSHGIIDQGINEQKRYPKKYPQIPKYAGPCDFRGAQLLVCPDHAPFPSDLNQPSEPDRFEFLPHRVK
ncbi:hypothetical protein EN943_09540 [Mesorhizobium sp. M7A.F.Ca.US.006.01.1.1]|nr:hypothetical protein EN943_09540 [Mesorhizobium sp. M7A.F.Ca.US.006.01.1.1]